VNILTKCIEPILVITRIAVNRMVKNSTHLNGICGAMIMFLNMVLLVPIQKYREKRKDMSKL
jgi:hypothetical protein